MAIKKLFFSGHCGETSYKSKLFLVAFLPKAASLLFFYGKNNIVFLGALSELCGE
jgi:hypothetical protein